MSVFPNRLPLAKIEEEIKDDKLSEGIIKTLNDYLEGFVGF